MDEFNPYNWFIMMEEKQGEEMAAEEENSTNSSAWGLVAVATVATITGLCVASIKCRKVDENF